MTNLSKIGIGLALTGAVQFALAQDNTHASSNPAGQAGKAGDKAGQKSKASDEEKAPPRPSQARPELDLGYTDWRLGGNRNKFRQYATPPHGFYFSRFLYAPQTDDLKSGLILDAKTPFQDDWRVKGLASFDFGRSIIRGDAGRNRFFDVSDFPIDGSERRITQGHLRQNLGRAAVFSVTAKEDEQDQIYNPPIDPLHQRTQTWNADLRSSLGKHGFGDVSYTDFRFFDRTEVEPNMHSARWQANYSHDITANVSAAGTVAETLIGQTGYQNSRVQSYGLGGSWDIAPVSRLMVNWRGEVLSLPNVLNAYDRSRYQIRGRFIQRLSTWTAEFGYNELDIQRENANHTFIDTPRFHTFEGRLSGPLNSWSRFSVDASRQTLQGRAMMETDDPRALYWRNSFDLRAKLNAFANFGDAYVSYFETDQNNDMRQTSVHSKILTYGADWTAKPDVTVYGEVSTEWWSAASLDPQALGLGLFFPNSTEFSLGANWNVNAAVSASAGYTQFWTKNPNPLVLPDGNNRGQFITVGATYRMANGNEVGVVFAPWRYTDREDSLRNYNTALLTLTARIKF